MEQASLAKRISFKIGSGAHSEEEVMHGFIRGTMNCLPTTSSQSGINSSLTMTPELFLFFTLKGANTI